jgi:hypothetical protein
VIIGDRSLVAGAPAKGLLSRLWPGRLISEVIDLAFFNHPNDLAVAVTSGRSVPTGRTPAVEFHVIASDHVRFFSTPVSLAQLAELLSTETVVVR